MDKETNMTCPMCGTNLDYTQKNDTHIYACAECPMIAIEFFNDKNIEDLKEYLKLK